MRKKILPVAAPSRAEFDTNANLIPNVARALLGLAGDRGISLKRLCRGLGFDHHDLLELDVRLSYRQIRQLIVRTQKILADPALGISAGRRQSPVSWGVPGLAMLTCETFGEAISYGIDHQRDVGALVEHLISLNEHEMVVEIYQKYSDKAIEPFLIEESFSSAVAISRYLVGDRFSPDRIELTYPKPGHANIYRDFFRCDIQFGAPVNRMICESSWLAVRLNGYDRITCGLVRKQLGSLIRNPTDKNDILEFVNTRLHSSLVNPRTLAQVAQEVNMSERTLRRHLNAENVSYSELLDETRFERAQDLLRNTKLSIDEIGQAIGYSDARSFRRAFKRWSAGLLPSQMRAILEHEKPH